MLTISVEHAGRRIDASALKARFIKNLIDREIELACLDEAINIFKVSHLPIEHGLDPGKYATELFLQSLGCIGILKNILSNALLKALSRKSALTIDLVRGCFFTAAQLDVMRQEMELGIAKVRELMTMEQLVQKAELVETNEGSSSVIKSKKLAPGETTPSHRHAAAKVWGSD